MANENASQFYNDGFYKWQKDTSYQSASQVAPFICSLFPFIAKVVDIGCGTGSWLAPFASMGKMIAGYDFGVGAKNNLMIPVASYHQHDLTTPLDLERAFDLAISLEVAEHLDASAADVFVATLAHAADIIMFSAAVPGQGGVHHINCQWPEYWAHKFIQHGFIAYDILRPLFWKNRNISSWYRQNMLLFCRNIDESLKNKLSAFTNFQCLPLKIEWQ